ncbi:MAG: phosphatidylserine decarboxylase family protein [Sedimentisphaerales bacterium]|nr:phosphatidylserine decarboxylase family protein [Sedimentisphaerales bacterium]
MPLTKYGWPQVAVYPSAILVFMVVLWFGAHPTTPAWVIQYVEIALAVILIWALSFFRDPERLVPDDPKLLLAPADGTITDIENVDENVFIKGKALKIGIFLSIFDVHINRSPCKARVDKITYKKGQFLDARNPESGRLNESNDLWLTRTDPPFDKLVVRQISGAIARRIVCDAKQSDELLAGRRFGMIKFGSRTELYVPLRDDVQCLVKKGDKVKAGLTPMLKYRF